MRNYERFLSNESVIVQAHNEKNFIVFDDTQLLEMPNQILINGTVELKARFIKKSQLAGILVHSIDLDDYTGSSCNRGIFPITSIVSQVFASPIQPPTTTTTITITTATVQTTTAVKKSDPCSNVKTKDLVVDESDCRYYYVCMPNRDEPVAHLQCPNKMQFSSKQKACTQEQFVSISSSSKTD